ncbi:MAG: SusC/RagA family TonB-linked outer membrane protein [Dinghuibacter sp.]|nr:SusC/RagA family TonB-linked outer membrane protein [Dinghuibacter sp.]
MTKIERFAFPRLPFNVARKVKYVVGVAIFCFCGMISFAQNKTITGKVVDDKTGVPLPNATIQAKGTNTSARSEADGSFSINVSQRTQTLVVSYIGYLSQEVSAASGSVGTIKLKSSPKAEDEVIVTGLGNRVKKSQYAGAASSVSAEKIRSVPVASFDQILQGRAPGLSVLSGSGQPGNAASVILRGPTSITGGSTPLYILDGIPVEAGVFQSINPNNFESVDVLKDAISAAQYGSRGAAGVIVATTKRGSSGKARINFMYQTGRKFKPQFRYDMMNAKELLKAQEDLGKFIPSATVPGWANSPINPTFAAQSPAVQAQRLRTLDSLGSINNNWDDVYFKAGNFSTYDLSISGGQGRTRVFSSIGLYKEDAIIRRSDMKRITIQNNIDYNDDKVSVSVTSALGYTKRNFQQSTTTNSVQNPFLSSRISAPYLTPKDANGNVNFTGSALPGYGAYLVDAMEKDKNYNDQIKATAGITGNYKVTDHITLNAFGAIDFRETQNTVFINPLSVLSVPPLNSNVRTQGGSMSEGLARLLQLNGRAGVTYNKTFKEKHDLNVNAFYEVIQNFSKGFTLQGFNLDFRRPNTIASVGPVNTGNAVNYFPNIGGSRFESGLQSVAGVATYTYNSKYTLNLSYRQDGSSILPETNRWQSFYAAGATWNMGKEKFLVNSKVVDVLRAKLSYGRAANADNFPGGLFFYDVYSTGLYIGGPTGLNQTLAVATPGNPDADWEYTSTLNFGIDFGLFRNRVFGDIQLYNKVTNGLYATQTLSATSGFGGIQKNSGKMGNKGIEYNINVDVIRNADLRWTVGANGAYNKNEILDLGGIPNFEQGTSRITVGLPLGSHFEVGWSGVDAATGKPLYLDVNGNVTDVYSAANKVQNWGTFYAPYSGGVTSNLSYKGFDFNILCSWQKGSTRVNNLEFFVENPGFLQQGFNQARSLDFWKAPGQQTRIQSPLYQNQFTSRLIQDASFFRLRNVSLSYSLPKTVTSKLKINNVRLFVQGQNLAVWTRWKGYDPEDDNNISLSEFPNPRAITGGIDITF